LKLGTLCDTFIISHSTALWLEQSLDSDEVASGSPLPGVKVITLYQVFPPLEEPFSFLFLFLIFPCFCYLCVFTASEIG